MTRDDIKAAEWYKKAATNEVIDVQYYLGSKYFHERGASHSNIQAMEWYQKAADQGFLYLNGEGMLKDLSELCDVLKVQAHSFGFSPCEEAIKRSSSRIKFC